MEARDNHLQELETAVQADDFGIKEERARRSAS